VKVIVDSKRCMGHAVCALMAPELIELDDLGYNVTGTRDVPPDQVEDAQRAAGACPESAISIVED
jgi:ferredoxin